MKWVVFYRNESGGDSFWEFRHRAELDAWIDQNTGFFFLVGPISLTVPVISVQAASTLDGAAAVGS